MALDEMEAWQLRNTIERMTGEVHMLSRQVHDLIEMMRHPMHYQQYGSPPNVHHYSVPDENFMFRGIDSPSQEEIDKLINISTKKEDTGWESV